MDNSKLSKLQVNVRIGGKGTPRRKKKVVHRTSSCDDKKLQSSFKKLNLQHVSGVSEANIFKSDGTVIHFSLPKVLASIPSNMFVISGVYEDKELTELVPGVLNQLERLLIAAGKTTVSAADPALSTDQHFLYSTSQSPVNLSPSQASTSLRCQANLAPVPFSILGVF